MRFVLRTSLILLLMPVPVFAQSGQTPGREGFTAGACGQPTALTYSLAAPVDQSPLIPVDIRTERNEPVYLEFTLSQTGPVVIQTTATDGSMDSYLTLFDSAGDRLAEDDDSGGNYDALLNLTLDAGTYCIQARPYSGNDGAFTLTVLTGEAAASFVPPETPSGEVSYGDLCQSPDLASELGRDIEPGVGTFSLDAFVEEGLRRDFRMTVLERTDVQIDASSLDFDTVLVLVDANGGYVAENDDGASGTDSRIVTSLEPGSYCLSLRGFASGGGAAQLTLTDEPEAALLGTSLVAACMDPEMASEYVVPLAPGMGSASAFGRVPVQSHSVWSVEVTEAVTVQIDAIGNGMDPVLSLIDASGLLIAENDDGPAGTDSRITQPLAPGRYCLAVEGYDGEGGEFELAISDNPAPDPGQVAPAQPCSLPDMTTPLGTSLDVGTGTFATPATVPEGSRQDWTFDVVSEVRMRISATSDQIDTVLKLVNAGGDVVAENDDGPIGTDSVFETVLQPGSYCLTLEGFAGEGGDAEVAFAEIDAATAARDAVSRGERIPEPGSDIAVEDLGVLEDTLQSSAHSPDLTKWSAFELDDAAEVQVNAVSVSGYFTLRLFSDSGEMLGEVSGLDGLTPLQIAQSLPAGRYLVAVSLNEGATSRLRNLLINRVGAD